MGMGDMKTPFIQDDVVGQLHSVTAWSLLVHAVEHHSSTGMMGRLM